MCACTRRTLLAGFAAMAVLPSPPARASSSEHREFIEAAFRMRDEAIRAGDQPYGAVLVREKRIIGFGPSRVILKKDATAHAEREAMREAQARIGPDLSGCILYSSSRPCGDCERAAALANVARMIHGMDAIDAGPPRRGAT